MIMQTQPKMNKQSYSLSEVLDDIKNAKKDKVSAPSCDTNQETNPTFDYEDSLDELSILDDLFLQTEFDPKPLTLSEKKFELENSKKLEVQLPILKKRKRFLPGSSEDDLE